MKAGDPWRAAVLLLLATPMSVSAHTEGMSGAGLVSGLIHPVTGLDHVVAMVAVGLWGAQLGGRLMWLLPVLFPVVMALGAVLGIRGLPLPGVEIGIALSGMLLGLVIVCSLRPAEWVAFSATGIFAIFHGYAHGVELPEAGEPLGYGIGFVVATGLLHLLGICFGLLQSVRGIGPKLVRGAGGVIAVTGAWYLVQCFSR